MPNADLYVGKKNNNKKNKEISRSGLCASGRISLREREREIERERGRRRERGRERE